MSYAPAGGFCRRCVTRGLLRVRPVRRVRRLRPWRIRRSLSSALLGFSGILQALTSPDEDGSEHRPVYHIDQALGANRSDQPQKTTFGYVGDQPVSCLFHRVRLPMTNIYQLYVLNPLCLVSLFALRTQTGRRMQSDQLRNGEVVQEAGSSPLHSPRPGPELSVEQDPPRSGGGRNEPSLRIRSRTKTHTVWEPGPDPCVSRSGPTPAMESPFGFLRI